MEMRISLLIAVLINIFYVTLGGLTAIDNDSKQFQDESFVWRFIFEVCKVVYFVIMGIVNFVGFAATKHAKSNYHAYNGLEMLLIVMSIGYNTLAITEIIGVSQFMMGSVKEESGILVVVVGMTRTILAARIINYTQFFMQVTYTIHVARITCQTAVTKSVTKDVILYLVISNFFLWATDSFVEVNNSHVQPIAFYYFGENWMIISRTLMPFYFFLRFNSFLMLLHAYFKV